MAAFTLLGIGAALAGGYLLGRKKKPATPASAPPPVEPAPRRPTRTAAQLAESTKPPDPIQAASENTLQAGLAAARTRKRAAAGNAGRVSTGGSNAQRAITNTGTRGTLAGY